MSKQTWFDVFFNTLTSSKEFKAVMTHDYKWDLEKMEENMKETLNSWKEYINDMNEKLKKSNEETAKANSIFEQLNSSFATPEALEHWQKSTWSWTKSQTNDEWWDINVEYFEKKDNHTWWFEAIAWMNDLKKDLKDSFIAPLKFKFLVQNLEQNKNIDPKKAELYKKISAEYEKFKISIPTWVLFYWPPWTWKTFITKKLAQELNAWYIEKSAWEFGSSYQHQTAQNIKSFFEKAKKLSHKWPILLFLDEIDSILSKRTNNIDAQKAEEVSQFLQEFNKLSDEAPNLIIVAATNRPDHLDPAILRSWRLDKKIYIWPPDKEARKELFEIYIKKFWRPHDELDYEKLADLTDNYVAADIENICDEVSRDASKHILDIASSLESWDFNEEDILNKLDNNKITMSLLEETITSTPSSLKMTDMSVYDNWLKQIDN